MSTALQRAQLCLPLLEPQAPGQLSLLDAPTLRLSPSLTEIAAGAAPEWAVRLLASGYRWHDAEEISRQLTRIRLA